MFTSNIKWRQNPCMCESMVLILFVLFCLPFVKHHCSYHLHYLLLSSMNYDRYISWRSIKTVYVDITDKHSCAGCRHSTAGLTSSLIILLKACVHKRPGSISNNSLHILQHHAVSLYMGKISRNAIQTKIKQKKRGISDMFEWRPAVLCWWSDL